MKNWKEQTAGVGAGGGGGDGGGAEGGGADGAEQKQPAYPRSLHAIVVLQPGVNSSALPNECQVHPQGRSQ